ncbi:hypothetical protein Micbo1qcDRAFT_158241 [Microdochium bolleyi]|uniref:Uncharacterized protein n=1 Tax=Microdochium bolleyi TaxID=196109 RepID=A0A136JFY8_9PEZI|nr:hypothetical protein Micbo1qcDRAFT_158241 [Microdochium bolleyi]
MPMIWPGSRGVLPELLLLVSVAEDVPPEGPGPEDDCVVAAVAELAGVVDASVVVSVVGGVLATGEALVRAVVPVWPAVTGSITLVYPLAAQ